MLSTSSLLIPYGPLTLLIDDSCHDLAAGSSSLSPAQTISPPPKRNEHQILTSIDYPFSPLTGRVEPANAHTHAHSIPVSAKSPFLPSLDDTHKDLSHKLIK